MSGGERVWIDEALTRAIAVYLAQSAGRRYQTLFPDEADGPLDPERKRMFIAMKREVLRLGGYEREIFVSQRWRRPARGCPASRQDPRWRACASFR